MNMPAPFAPTETLPRLIDRATAALDAARTSAEVLEARDMARVAYDAAKSAARMVKAKEAHDSILAEVHRAQAHSMAIRARAEMRLAEEYDAEKAAGNIAAQGQRTDLLAGDKKVPTARDIGLRHDEIHEARRLRDAERADPGIIERTLNGMVERGEEPTRAALKREVIERAKPQRVMDPRALWLWGRVKDFERENVLAATPSELCAEMTEPMRADVRRLLPPVIAFLNDMETRL